MQKCSSKDTCVLTWKGAIEWMLLRAVRGDRMREGACTCEIHKSNDTGKYNTSWITT